MVLAKDVSFCFQRIYRLEREVGMDRGLLNEWSKAETLCGRASRGETHPIEKIRKGLMGLIKFPDAEMREC